MRYLKTLVICTATFASFLIWMVPPLHSQAAPAAVDISAEDQKLLTDLVRFLKNCSEEQIGWLAETRVLIDEPEQKLKVKLARSGKGEFYGQVWDYVVGLQQLKERTGETTHENTIARLVASLPTDNQAALGIVRFQHFSDQQGRTIEAELLRMNGQKVIAAFKDGREFEMPVASLNDDDREKVDAWIESQADASAPTLVTEAALQFSQKRILVLCPYPAIVPETIHQGSTLKGTGYEVTLENRGRPELPALTAQYYVFYDLGPQPNRAGSKHIRGEITVRKLKTGERFIFQTVGAHPYDSILEQYMSFASTNRTGKMEDLSRLIRSIENGGQSQLIPDIKLSGLWLRVYSGQTRVAEYVYGKAAEDALERYSRPTLTTPEFEFPDGASKAR